MPGKFMVLTTASCPVRAAWMGLGRRVVHINDLSAGGVVRRRAGTLEDSDLELPGRNELLQDDGTQAAGSPSDGDGLDVGRHGG